MKFCMEVFSDDSFIETRILSYSVAIWLIIKLFPFYKQVYFIVCFYDTLFISFLIIVHDSTGLDTTLSNYI